jgi:2-dehydropantoate 2-reductase
LDAAFMAMKAHDTARPTHMTLPRLGPAGYGVSAQNCWNDPTLAAIAGPDRWVGLVVPGTAVAPWEPGRVERGAEKGSGSARGLVGARVEADVFL